MEHIGNLEITAENCNEYAHVTKVTGYLLMDVNAILPALTTIEGALYIYNNADICTDADLVAANAKITTTPNLSSCLPALNAVGSDVGIHTYANLPALAKIGGELTLLRDANLPALNMATVKHNI